MNSKSTIKVPASIMARASGIVDFGGQMAGVVSAPVTGCLIQTSGGNDDSAFWFMIIVLAVSAVVTATLGAIGQLLNPPPERRGVRRDGLALFISCDLAPGRAIKRKDMP